MNKGRVVVVVALLIGVWCLVTGFCDLDWMINTYYWNMQNGSAEVNGLWWFNTYFSMEWWNAYMVSVARIIIGSMIIGVIISILMEKK